MVSRSGNTNPGFAAQFMHKVCVSTAGIQPFIVRAFFSLTNQTKPFLPSFFVHQDIFLLHLPLTVFLLSYSLLFLETSVIPGLLSLFGELVLGPFPADLPLRWKKTTHVIEGLNILAIGLKKADT